MITHVMYLSGERAILVERDGRKHLRHVFVREGLTLRGEQGFYPMLPQDEPVEIDQATFDEAWAEGA